MGPAPLTRLNNWRVVSICFWFMWADNITSATSKSERVRNGFQGCLLLTDSGSNMSSESDAGLSPDSESNLMEQYSSKDKNLGVSLPLLGWQAIMMSSGLWTRSGPTLASGIVKRRGSRLLIGSRQGPTSTGSSSSKFSGSPRSSSAPGNWRPSKLWLLSSSHPIHDHKEHNKWHIIINF